MPYYGCKMSAVWFWHSHWVFFPSLGSDSVFEPNRVGFVVGNTNQPTQPLYQFTSRWRLIILALKTRHALQSILQRTKGMVNKPHTDSLNSRLCAWITPSFLTRKTLAFNADHSITALEVEAKASKDVKSNCHWFSKSVVIVLSFCCLLCVWRFDETASILLMSETEILQTFESPPCIYKRLMWS